MSNPYVGEIRLFSFSRIPEGWLACNGALISITQYQTLYALLGPVFGGDGITTFAIPDLRGRLPIHQGQGQGLPNYVMGQISGSENVTLLLDQMPPHTHPLFATTAQANINTVGNNAQLATLASDTMYTNDASGLTATSLATGSIGHTSGDTPHDNLMPTLTGSFCIAWQGIYPVQN